MHRRVQDMPGLPVAKRHPGERCGVDLQVRRPVTFRGNREEIAVNTASLNQGLSDPLVYHERTSWARMGHANGKFHPNHEMGSIQVSMCGGAGGLALSVGQREIQEGVTLGTQLEFDVS